MKKIVLFIISFYLISFANAHSGRTDAYGGHNDYSNGTYHYHNSGNQNQLNKMYNNTGSNLGKAIGDLFFNQNNSNQQNNSKQYNTSMKGKFLLDWGTTYQYYPGSHLNGSDGMRCVITGVATFNCNNGIYYKPCGASSFCGTDGTRYDEIGDFTYTSFGVTCNHRTNTWTCR